MNEELEIKVCAECPCYYEIADVVAACAWSGERLSTYGGKIGKCTPPPGCRLRIRPLRLHLSTSLGKGSE